jgi:hypothetical protein
VALGSTQPLTEMSTRRSVRRADNLTDCHEIGEPQPLDPSGPVEDCTGIALPYLQSDISFSGKSAVSVNDERVAKSEHNYDAVVSFIK